MIRYRLVCPKSHEFEGWFPSSDGCDSQIAKKLVACPTCGATKVSKALMAPSVVTSERSTKARADRRRDKREATLPVEATTPVAPSQMPPSQMLPSQMLTGPQREMLRQLKDLRDKVLSQAEYVGPRFAEEARRIHSEDAEGRGIYGEATREEVEDLLGDGIDILPIPVLPDDHN